MTKEILTEIVIHACPQVVWQVLTAQGKYQDWNPFIRTLEGNLKVGEKLKVVIQPPDSSKMTFKPEVLVYIKNKELKWKGKLLFSGVFDGTHTFELKDNQDGTTTFRQSEIFEGWLVRFISLDKTEKGFNAMNRALKIRCEELES